MERSTYVLFSSLALILLFAYWQPLGGTVWAVTSPLGQAVLYAAFAFGWLLACKPTIGAALFAAHPSRSALLGGLVVCLLGLALLTGRALLAAGKDAAKRAIEDFTLSDEEKAHHYLWRFWRHIPKSGFITVYDRSWYGRVLVERVEGFAPVADWDRAYFEINAFERQLVDHGAALESARCVANPRLALDPLALERLRSLFGPHRARLHALIEHYCADAATLPASLYQAAAELFPRGPSPPAHRFPPCSSSRRFR